MAKRFNTTGVCIDKNHYMVNIENKLNKIEKLIDNDLYFTINRPRQFGKTTTISQIYKRLKDKHLVIRASFEGVGDLIFQDEVIFSGKIINIFSNGLKYMDKESALLMKEVGKDISSLDGLSDAITEFVERVDKDVILIIDEVDKSSNNQLFLSFLGMLRNKYLLAAEGLDLTFKSVILAGVHDVKSLKLKLRPDDEKKYNSPWNIAVDFDIDMSFSPEEIETMLIEYDEDYELNMDTKALSERIYFFTSGYPYLVSRICQHIDEKLYGDFKKTWTVADIDEGVKIIVKETNTLFDSLIKNLENNSELMDFVKQVLIDGAIIPFTISDTLINLGITYGFFKEKDGRCIIANRIFEQYIYNHLIAKEIRTNLSISRYNGRDKFLTRDNGLNVEMICERFQQYMKENYSSMDEKFIEREGRLIFLAFIAPIINGVGFAFREVQTSEEKRLDIVITYNSFKYIIELKIWHGDKYNEEGLRQLCDYLDIHGLDKGYLVSFNFNKGKEYKKEVVELNGKEIFSVMV